MWMDGQLLWQVPWQVLVLCHEPTPMVLAPSVSQIWTIVVVTQVPSNYPADLMQSWYKIRCGLQPWKKGILRHNLQIQLIPYKIEYQIPNGSIEN
jgi:hypothetical protein